MASVMQRRKVLVLSDEASIKRLFILVERLENEDRPEEKREPALARFNRRHFEEIIVDLRCLERRTSKEIHGIGEMRPSLMGKTLVLTIQVNGPKTLALVERYLLNNLPPSLLWLICQR